jgi:hypothetical protein
MNAVVPSLKAIDFEYTAYDGLSSLFPAIKVYDLSSGTATLVNTVGMTHVFNGTYWSTLTFTVAQAGKSFLIQKTVYTDGTFATVNQNYPSGSEIVGPVDGFDQDFGRSF